MDGWSGGVLYRVNLTRPLDSFSCAELFRNLRFEPLAVIIDSDDIDGSTSQQVSFLEDNCLFFQSAAKSLAPGDCFAQSPNFRRKAPS
jgi:hypothetical protein